MTATEIAAAIGTGKTTCEAVTRACLDRIATRETDVQAWAYVMPSRQSRRRALDRGDKRNPLAGAPFGVKDIIDTADMPTQWGTPIHKGPRLTRRRLRGAVPQGRRAAARQDRHHRIRQPASRPDPQSARPYPHARRLVVRSAAAVADLMVPLAIGTQTTGSTIRPASFCGVIGYRPTRGEHRLHGVMEASGSLDTLGIMARSVEDVALYRDVLLGITPEPIPELTGRRISRSAKATSGTNSSPLPKRWSRTPRCGWPARAPRVSEFDLPADFARLNEAHRWISSFEFARTFTWEIEHHWDEISDTLRGGRLKEGIGGDFDRYVASKRVAEECRLRLDDLWGDIDMLLTPAAFGEAPVGFPPSKACRCSSSGPYCTCRRSRCRCSRGRPECRSARNCWRDATTTATCSPARDGRSKLT